ncbi:MAG: tetratricopeptide repeat protein [Planctomycetaceae bacterium]
MRTTSLQILLPTVIALLGCGRGASNDQSEPVDIADTAEATEPTAEEQAETKATAAANARDAHRLDESIQLYTEAIELSENNPDFYFGRGLAFLEKEEFEVATLDFNEVIRRSPTHVGARRQRELAANAIRDQARKQANEDLFNLVAGADQELWGQKMDNDYILERALGKVQQIDKSEAFSLADQRIRKATDKFIRLSYQRVALIRRATQEILPRFQKLRGKAEDVEFPDSFSELFKFGAELGRGTAIAEELKEELEKLQKEADSLTNEHKAWVSEFDRSLRWELFPQPRSQFVSSIESVLDGDKLISTVGRTNEEVVADMKAIDLSATPLTFSELYRKHIDAWRSRDSNRIQETYDVVLSTAYEHGVDPHRYD